MRNAILLIGEVANTDSMGENIKRGSWIGYRCQAKNVGIFNTIKRKKRKTYLLFLFFLFHQTTSKKSFHSIIFTFFLFNFF